jgi:hypothetical protein
MWAAGAWPATAVSQTPAAQASGLRAEVHSAIIHLLPTTLMLKEIDNLLAFLAEAKLQPVTGVFIGNDQEDQDGAPVANLLVMTVGRGRRRSPTQSRGDADGRNWWLQSSRRHVVESVSADTPTSTSSYGVPSSARSRACGGCPGLSTRATMTQLCRAVPARA